MKGLALGWIALEPPNGFVAAATGWLPENPEGVGEEEVADTELNEGAGGGSEGVDCCCG